MQAYSPQAHSAAEALAAAMRPTGYILLLFFLGLEILEQSVETKLDGGVVTPKMLGSIFFNYAFAYLLILNSSVLFEAIMYIANLLTKVGNKSVPEEAIKTAIEVGKIKGWFFKNIIQLIAIIVEFFGLIATRVMLMMRYYQLYIANALAPVIIALFVNKTLRSVAINFIKLFAAYALQGLVLLIIIRLFPYMITDELVKVNSGILPSAMSALSSITKGFIYVVVIMGSARYIKQILGVS
ncbi:hypothetical protein ACVR1I_03025 [Streptococcus cameli]